LNVKLIFRRGRQERLLVGNIGGGNGNLGGTTIDALPPVIRTTARWRFVWIGSLALLVAVCGGLAYLAWSNHDRAERWEVRSTRLERNAEALNTLLIQRSTSLNARTRELNGMAAKVRRATTALQRSEQDVASLARRQRQLANEKAQIEDKRAELAAESAKLGSFADAFIDCKGRLIDILQYVVNDDYASANYYFPDVQSSCQGAEDELADYNATYGG
jgi:hypothetical protein